MAEQGQEPKPAGETDGEVAPTRSVLDFDAPPDGATAEQRAAGDYAPTDSDLLATVTEILDDDSSLGVPRVLAKARQLQPHWKLSEKRLRQYMKSHPRAAPKHFPISKHDARLVDLAAKVAPLLEVRRIDQQKGRGLFAKDDIKEGTKLIEEDAWVFDGSPIIRQRIQEGVACAHCGQIYSRPSHHPPCSFHTPKAGLASEPPCKQTFCSKACQSAHVEAYGAFTCPSRNPAYAALLAASTDHRAPVILFLITLRIALAHQRSEKEGREELLRAEAFTGISERTRREATATPEEVEEHFGATWRKGFDLYLAALHLDSADGQAESTIKPNGTPSAESPFHLKRPLSSAMAKALLTFDGYLLMMGRVSLNQEDDGGLYHVHASLNHSCAPNAVVRRAGPGAQRSTIFASAMRPSRLFVISLTDLPKDTEILLTYVSPHLDLNPRREKLARDYLFTCSCPRCDQERTSRRRMERLVDSMGGGKVTMGPNGMMMLNLNHGDGDEGDEGGGISSDLLAALSGATRRGGAQAMSDGDAPPAAQIEEVKEDAS